MKRFIILLCISTFAISPLFAQFKGTVLDRKQRGAKGVKVWRKNTTESTKTNNQGVFMLEDVSANDTLVITVNRKYEAVFAVGSHKDVTLLLGKTNFRLREGSQEEVIDYKKSYTSYSSNILVREQIARMSANTIYDVLRSSIPGVTVTEGSNGSQITIRGGSSFESNTEPLFVVDGTVYESSAEVDRQIMVNDIDKIEVNKDGGGYGVKGANGVIIITTNKH
jgi:hypothetical protein